MRRLFTPRWIFIHCAIGALSVLLVFLGIWQLNRLDDRRARNAAIEANTQMDIATATQELGASEDEWRRVTLSGRYLTESEVSVINRSQDGVAGDNIAVVFETENNGLFVVNRGFVPLTVSSRSLPEDPLSIVGFIRPNQTRGALGAIDSSTKGTKEFQRFDLERIKNSLGININTAYYVQLIKESPSSNSPWPMPVPFPEVDEGPHFSYAMQWFFFSFVALAGWAVVIARKIREGASDPALEQTSA
jgi:cytochrome oxidase assembly protein ShyY1